MTLAYSVLASGSGGNCTAVLCPDAEGCATLFEPAPSPVILFDAGLSPRCTRERLRRVGLGFSAVTDIVLTHLDSDHLHGGWESLLSGPGAVRVHLHRSQLGALRSRRITIDRLRLIDDGPAPIVDDAALSPVSLPHDQSGTTGWVFERQGVRLGLATDLGRVPPTLLDAFVELDALLLESNYDPEMQRASRRPEFLKTRIMGGRGHLSNEECVDALAAIAPRCRLRSITLLHLSRQCNHPTRIRTMLAERVPALASLVELSHQHDPTPLRRLVCVSACDATLR